jgi:thiamine pyrophosphate-dependent acetolactate synthase large subunit-like protein
MLRALDIPYVALNPGASFRGLHDSLVNRLGNTRPKMLLCLHEEAAVAIAHGWAKVTGKAMMAIVHSNVGLMHATMAMFNAWCDRMPLLLFGATGPMDANKRRPWIDWIHTSKDQGALVRDYTKWDDQPTSFAAIQESILRARQISETLPRGPTYVCFDVGLQEQKVETPLPIPDVRRFQPPAPVTPAPKMIADIARRLYEAERPVILMGRVSRDQGDWDARKKLAEALGAVVFTDLKLASAFPTDHPLHGAPAGSRLHARGNELLREADVILSLEWRDLAGIFRAAFKQEPVKAEVIRIAMDQHIHNGWSMDYLQLPAVDTYCMADPDATAHELLDAVTRLGPRKKPAWPGREPFKPRALPDLAVEAPISVPHVSAALQKVLGDRNTCLIHHPLSWSGSLWTARDPLDFLGGDGGGGVGGGPGQSVGAALALRGTGRFALSICGDGDFLMGLTAVWTAVHYKIPILFVIVNNHSYYNDELHQEHLAHQRGRPEANAWIGQQMLGPELDIPTLARGQGAKAFGQVTRLADLPGVLKEAIAEVDAGHCVVVDVRVLPGYQEPGTVRGSQV